MSGNSTMKAKLASANLFELFQASYANHLDDIFLSLPGGESYRFGDIDTLCAAMASCLIDLKVQPGQRILVQTDKSAATVALYLAVLRIGAVFVPLNTGYTPSEVAYFIRDAQPEVFFCTAAKLEILTPVAKAQGTSKILVLGDTKDEGFWKVASQSSGFKDVIPRDEEDLAAFLYTSGTTGRSKGAMLSHKNLASNAQTLHKLWQFEPGDVLLHALPIFHIHGLFVALHCAILNASKVLFLPSYEVNQVRQSLAEATVMMGVPTFYSRLLALEEFTGDDCRAVRLFISGSAPMTEPLHQEWTKRTGTKILERYGMTEAGMITSNPYQGERLPGTVGYALPGVSVRVADNQGNSLPAGEIGVIEVKGPNIFQGYWQMPEKTAEEFRPDGYFITGDVGLMTEDGRVSIVGREKDLIISGGYNIYPKEIEVLLDEHPAVNESAVIGITHPDLGESVAAVVVVQSGKQITEAELIEFVKESLARFKQPRQIFFVEALPRNAMGKVQKNLLREEYKTSKS